jgi:hypothetical protein
MAPLTLDRVWRGSGIAFVVTFVVAYLIYGSQPKIGASAETVVSLYDGDRTRILIASALLGLSVLNRLWFAAALASWWPRSQPRCSSWPERSGSGRHG